MARPSCGKHEGRAFFAPIFRPEFLHEKTPFRYQRMGIHLAFWVIVEKWFARDFFADRRLPEHVQSGSLGGYV